MSGHQKDGLLSISPEDHDIYTFILVDMDTLLYKVEMIWNGNYTGFYTIATIEEKG